VDWISRDRCRNSVPDPFDRHLHNSVPVPAQLKHDGGSSSVPGEDHDEEQITAGLNDFGMGIVGPRGFYIRNDLFYYEASIGAHPLGGSIAGAVTSRSG
jgi:hypothetical protein